ncbi:TonB-dependent receptor domain-containing protein [Pontibacter silvestris]|uniref:TonB-dependent receptor domain-containing protein n=1 Tax=Pontibacter silvestris TaxID=2305183 RepID=A0ABW4X552_9BACT|nr:TonB-dependent receptor [Pontibacter silvestris]MCC9134871.1 TonB-dependent receptor [Pontibacter silvestris]
MKLIVSIMLAYVSVVVTPAFAQGYGTLAGEVTDVAGAPLAHATIQLEGYNIGSAASEAGKFTLTKVPEGLQKVHVSAVGFQDRVKEISVKAGQKQHLVIQLKEKVDELKQVVVTATRMEQHIKDVPIPVNVISAEQIQRMGSVRLNEVLAEQTGLQIISDHGTGLQIQGLSADYVLILVDGEPVIGRTTGVLDLTRLAVGNIERVEVIKGPASSLYGSEAMAGVVNIITKKSIAPFSSTARARYSSFQTLNTSADIRLNKGSLGFYLFADRLSSDGYDLTPGEVGRTAPPFTSYTLNPKVSYSFSSRLKAKVSARWYTEDQENLYGVSDSDVERIIFEKANRQDWSLMPTLEYTFGSNSKLTLENYTSRYKTDSDMRYTDDASVYDESYFNQLFNRSQFQLDVPFKKHHISTLGAGYTLEEVEATRYDDQNQFKTTFVFGQHQWSPGSRLNIVAGARYDHHNAYASRFSPKLSAKYEVLPWLAVQASAGGGYKAPDFRQLLLNFTNAVAGYSVFGSRLANEGVERLEQEGQIARILIDPATIGEIKAENSMAYNMGLHISALKNILDVNLNAYRNNIHDLIQTLPIATKVNGQSVYSYVNVSKVVTQGVEVQADYKPLHNLTLSLGYQFLDAKDVEVKEKLENGEVYKRDPATGEVMHVKPADYGGLFNRSRHSGNVKIFYDNQQYDFNLSLRGLYRGRFGTGDVNGNQILDVDQEYADGYFTWNITAAKKLLKQLTLEAGVNNLFAVKNIYEPSLSGRVCFAGLILHMGSN